MFKGLATGNFKSQSYFVPVCSPALVDCPEIPFQPFINHLLCQITPVAERNKAFAKVFRKAV